MHTPCLQAAPWVRDFIVTAEKRLNGTSPLQILLCALLGMAWKVVGGQSGGRTVRIDMPVQCGAKRTQPCLSRLSLVLSLMNEIIETRKLRLDRPSSFLFPSCSPRQKAESATAFQQLSYG